MDIVVKWVTTTTVSCFRSHNSCNRCQFTVPCLTNLSTCQADHVFPTIGDWDHLCRKNGISPFNVSTSKTKACSLQGRRPDQRKLDRDDKESSAVFWCGPSAILCSISRSVRSQFQVAICCGLCQACNSVSKLTLNSGCSCSRPFRRWCTFELHRSCIVQRKNFSPLLEDARSDSIRVAFHVHSAKKKGIHRL